MDMISKLNILEKNGVRFVTFKDFRNEFNLDPFNYGKELFLLKKGKEFLVCFNEELSLKRIFYHYINVKIEVENEKNLKFFTK